MSALENPASTDFESWRHENLARFARDARAEIKAQAERIKQLEEERRAAIDAYRDLLRQRGLAA